MKREMNLFGAALLLLCSSCADELPEPMHRPRTVVHFAADWSDLASDLSAPASFDLRVGDERYTVEGARFDATLFSENDYTAVAATRAAGITLSGTSAFVATQDGYLIPEPGMLAAAVVDLERLGEVRELQCTLPMKQRTFRLRFSLQIDDTEIAAASGTLTNVAAGCDLRTGRSLKAGDIRIAFSAAVEKEHPCLVADARILGVVENVRQVLTLEATTAEDEKFLLESDMTDLLAALESRDDKCTLTLEADLRTSETTGSVIDWIIVEGEKIIL